MTNLNEENAVFERTTRIVRVPFEVASKFGNFVIGSLKSFDNWVVGDEQERRYESPHGQTQAGLPHEWLPDMQYVKSHESKDDTAR